MSKPVTLNFTWTPGAKPVLAGKATVKRLDFGVGTGEWADTALMPNEVAVSTKVIFVPASSGPRDTTRHTKRCCCAAAAFSRGQASRGAVCTRSPAKRARNSQHRTASQVGVAGLVAQHRHADAIAGFQFVVAVDEDALELRRARLRQHFQGEVAQVAVVALEEGQSGHRQCAAVWRDGAGGARRIAASPTCHPSWAR